MEVHIHVDKEGLIHSARMLQSEKDHEIVETLENGGLEYASISLLQEALKQECLFQALLTLTKGDELSEEKLQFSLETVVDKFLRSASQDIVSQTIEKISRERRD